MPSSIAIGAGVFEIRREQYRTGQFHVEYKSSFPMWKFSPMAGIMMTFKGSVYTYAGILFDISSKHFFLTPSFCPGYYYKGKGRDLGYPLEFRSSIEVGYKFNDLSRLGVQFYHISNASLGKRNPGEESLVLSYSFPIKSLLPKK